MQILEKSILATSIINYFTVLHVAKINVIIYFICLRLCVSVTMAAYRKKIFPDNKYIRVTEQQAWDFLKKVQQVEIEQWSDQVIKRVFG